MVAKLAAEQHLVLDEQVLRAFDERPVRVTYDQGRLELMTLSPEHERYQHLIGQLIIALVEELGSIAGYGSMTFKKRRTRRGLEPDRATLDEIAILRKFRAWVCQHVKRSKNGR
ncbi:MAG: hypothetical protein AB7K24_08965 [Gemmataceae bacterium]